MPYKKIFFLLSCFMFPAFLLANELPTTVDEILKLKNQPEGVIIEIVTDNPDGLKWALPKAQANIKKLKAHFPELDIAIVTHGRELFALAKDKKKNNQRVHSLTQALKKDGVTLHVCGTYAGWKGLTDEDFPDYVNVSATGPAQINDYKAVGFLHIIINSKKQVNDRSRYISR